MLALPNDAHITHADIAVSDSLDVTVIGSGSVTYTGSPQVKQSILGSGSLQKK